MKERPILFSPPMVRAILDERKTQTRRIVNSQPESVPDGWYPDAYNKTDRWCFWGPRGTEKSGCCTLPHFRNPYGQPGDKLWVKETFYCDDYRYPEIPEDERADSDWRNRMLYYRADGEELCQQIPECDCSETKGCWRPSIFMPRWACRITLEITAVRVERLQEIGEEDSIREGVDAPTCPQCGYTRWDCRFHMDHKLCGNPEPASAIDVYAELWDSINGKTHPWASNPWIWVVTFKKL